MTGVQTCALPISLNRVERCTIAASKFDVELLPDADGAATEPAHIEYESEHHHHDHEHHGGHTHVPEKHSSEAEGRSLADILDLLASSGLAAPVKELAARIFRNLGEAEARVHGVDVERIHFHEVGAVDAIVDIVGFAVLYHKLAIEAAYVSALPLGSGMVKTAHGHFPVPGPAVLELLKRAGAPVSASHFPYECLTPTGAAILTTIAVGWGENPAFASIDGIGYGAGHLNPADHPNVVRIMLGTAVAAQGRGADQFRSEIVAVVEANLDDCSPQILAHTMELLLDQGALDVALCPLTMKKSRPGHKISVICRPADRQKMQKMILKETTSLGVRSHLCERLVEEREFRQISLGDGPDIRIKIGRDEAGQIINVHPEYEDMARYCRQSGVTLKEVLQKSLLKVLKDDARR